MKMRLAWHSLIWFLLLVSSLTLQGCNKLYPPVPNFHSFDVEFNLSTSGLYSNLIISFLVPYDVESDTMMCNNIQMRNLPLVGQYSQFGQSWQATNILTPPATSSYTCTYRHANKDSFFSVPVISASTILAPHPGQTVHASDFLVRYHPIADSVLLSLTTSQNVLLTDPSEKPHVDTGEFVFTPSQLMAIPTGSIKLSIAQTYDRMLSGTPFRSAKENGYVYTSTPLNFAP